ncbi:MAG: hypothetical protein JRS35_28510, partial [Deltaproteobacteria bacterium]|nr:hypothetical protein [Deltaproteobacteria bacterium]
MTLGGLTTRSIRTKLLALVAVVSLVVAVCSTIFHSVSSGSLLEQQMRKRGRYIAGNLAYNAKYGVLTEDRPLLTQLLEGALSAGEAEESDLAGAVIRDARGSILAQQGVAFEAPSAEAGSDEVEAVTVEGESVIVFRAAVTTSTSTGGSGDIAAEFGLDSPGTGAVREEVRGHV